MDRRTLLKTGLLASAGGLLIPRTGIAAVNPVNSPLAGSVYYTAESPGRWAGKEDGHAPTFERDGDMVQVTTAHEMDGYVHYIVKHVLLDENLEFVAETMFDPEKDSPVSTYDIRGLKRRVYALSQCNKHDVWLGAMEV